MLKRLYRKFLAFYRLDLTVVCEESAVGKYDYHDYPDTEYGQPFHFEELPCKRCGKLFSI